MSQQGQSPPIFTSKMNAALQEFQRARMQAALHTISARLRGNTSALLAFNEVADQLRMTSSAAHGLQTIPVRSIVGSVGRYADFSRTFLPLKASDRERWASVRTAANVTQLPPIEVYQIGEAYFVLDGNHRVSIARREGLDYLDAYVTEVKTRVALSPNDNPDNLIIKAEYAAFLEATHLDALRPGADLLTSVPGQYAHLENLIEAYRYLVEEAAERPLSDQEAVCRWYDEAYLPMMEVAREFDILSFFPGRTETDFYVWMAVHQTTLHHELGWEIRPETAVSLFAQQLLQQGERPLQRLARRALNTFRPAAPDPAEEQWATARLIARYSDRLFQDILTPVSMAGDAILLQALRIAALEQAQLCGLITRERQANDEDWVALVKEAFEEQCQLAGASGHLALESGDLFQRIAARSGLTDLALLDRAWLLDEAGALTPRALALLTMLQRPALVIPATARPIERPLLAYDGQPRAKGALFVAAYMGEQWGMPPVVVVVGAPGHDQAKALDHARRYLEMHEVEGTFVAASGGVTEAILATAVAHDADCILLGGADSGKASNRAPGQTTRRLLVEWERPLFICP